MPKTIKFKQLHLISYTGHDEIVVDFKDITKLSGKNGEGKSSIGGSPAWIFWGVDLAGGKFNPSPTNRPFERVYGSLLLSVDGSDVLLGREIVKGANKFYINEVPQKATEFDAFISSLFNKEQFLSLYSPGFFFTQHWTKQREQVMQHVTPPSNKEVFQAMSRTAPDQKAKDIILNPQAARLEEELKKLSITDLEKKHADLKGKNDKLHIQSQGSVKTLNAQLEALGPAKDIDREALQSEGEELDKKIQSYEDDKSKVTQWENQRSRLQSQIDGISQRIVDGKQDHTKTKETEINTSCSSCGQELTEEAKTTSLNNKKVVMNGIAKRVNDLLEQKKELAKQLEALPHFDGPDYSVADLISRIGEINSLLQSDIVRAKAATDLEMAKQNETDYLKAKNDSIFVLDSIKSFKAVEAELQVSKVQSLFTTLSVRLFDYVQSTGEYKPTFVIQMDGKDYDSLSAGEKIGAGLELSEVLYKQSELIVPTFVDGIESYTGKVAVFGQLITGRAVLDQKLLIESEDVQ
jgi:ribosomal protein L44E